MAVSKLPTTETSYASVAIFSDDPELIAIENILTVITYVGKKGLTLRHLKVLMGVKKMLRVTKNKTNPTAKQIATMIGLAPIEFEKELRELVEWRYLHEVMPTFGPLVMKYKLGATGGMMMKTVLPKLR